MGSKRARKRRNKRKRRQEKAVQQFGPGAKRPHKGKSGRTGAMHQKKTPPKEEKDGDV